MRALIVEQSRDRSAVAAARALRYDGWTVGTGAWQPTIASLSRDVDRYHRIEEAEGSQDRFISEIRDAVNSHGYEVVFCTYDVGLLLLSERRDEIGGASVPYAEHSIVRESFDKLAFVRAAAAVGLGVPRTEEATDEAIAAWRGPVVVKARVHAPTRYDTAAFDRIDDARDFIMQLRAGGAEPLLQERITGRLGAVVVVADTSSNVIAEMHQLCERSWPIGAGDTARARTIAVDAELSERVRKLIADLGWFGLAQLEFLLDDEGRPRFTDFNGRSYGSMALAQAAGLNVFAYWARLATGRSVPAAPTPRVGARFQWLNRDLAASRDADGWRGVAKVAAVAPFAAHSVGSVRDPGPAMRFLVPELARRTAGRIVPRRKGSEA